MERTSRPWPGWAETADRGVVGDMGDVSLVDIPSWDESEGTDRRRLESRGWWKSSLSDEVREKSVGRSWWYERGWRVSKVSDELYDNVSKGDRALQME